VSCSQNRRNGVIIAFPQVFCNFLFHLSEVGLDAGDVVSSVIPIITLTHCFILGLTIKIISQLWP
jgi:hypothetical protein